MISPYALSVRGKAATFSGAAFHAESPAGTNVGNLLIPNTGSWSAYVTESFGFVLLQGGSAVPFILVLDANGANLYDTLTITVDDTFNLPFPISQSNINTSGQIVTDAQGTPVIYLGGGGAYIEQTTPALSLQERQNGV